MTTTTKIAGRQQALRRTNQRIRDLRNTIRTAKAQGIADDCTAMREVHRYLAIEEARREQIHADLRSAQRAITRRIH